MKDSEPASDVDPVIDQTRSVTLQMFSADLAQNAVLPSPAAARRHWLETSERRRDLGMVRIVERLDDETFATTWNALVFGLRARGPVGMAEWLVMRDRDRP